MSKYFFQIIFVFTVVFILQACSAGGGETGTGQDDIPTVPEDTSVTVGVITGFGSVYVNGVKYATTENTSLSIDGDETKTESELAVGMLVTLSGSVSDDGSNGVANSITFENNVEGTVITNDLANNGELDVMGQNIIVDKDTIFHSQNGVVDTVEKILPGHVVEVSGFSSGDGNIYATRIELKRDSFNIGEEIEVKGSIRAIIDSSSFTIGQLTVTYLSTVLNGFTDPVKVGDFVSVKSIDGVNGNGELIASEIELKEKNSLSSSLDVDKEIELEGVISDFNSEAKTFSLNTESIVLAESPKYEGGAFENLSNKVKIKIEGIINQDGVIVASEVTIKQAFSGYYEGNITAIDYEARSITLLNLEIFINNSTRLKDDLEDESDDIDYDRQYFNFDNLRVGDNVEVSVFSKIVNTGDGTVLVASRLERNNEKEQSDVGGTIGIERELEGVVSNYTMGSPTITVSGVTINIENVQLEGILDNGVTVEVHGLETTNGWFATEIGVRM